MSRNDQKIVYVICCMLCSIEIYLLNGTIFVVKNDNFITFLLKTSTAFTIFALKYSQIISCQL